MRNYNIITTMLILVSLSCRLNAQTAVIQETEEQKAKRLEWFAEAKLGIFIHWGIYAVNGVSESWSFFNNNLPHKEYMKQCGELTVLTIKHHDGVTLWDTKIGELSTVKSTLAKRDLLTPFAKEEPQQGLKLGFYYSLLDWSHPDYPNKTRTEVRYQPKEAIYNTRAGIPTEHFQGYTTLNKASDILLPYKPNGPMLSYQVYNKNYCGVGQVISSN